MNNNLTEFNITQEEEKNKKNLKEMNIKKHEIIKEGRIKSLTKVKLVWRSQSLPAHTFDYMNSFRRSSRRAKAVFFVGWLKDPCTTIKST